MSLLGPLRESPLLQNSVLPVGGWRGGPCWVLAGVSLSWSQERLGKGWWLSAELLPGGVRARATWQPLPPVAHFHSSARNSLQNSWLQATESNSVHLCKGWGGGFLAQSQGVQNGWENLQGPRGLWGKKRCVFLSPSILGSEMLPTQDSTQWHPFQIRRDVDAEQPSYPNAYIHYTPFYSPGELLLIPQNPLPLALPL